MQAASARTRQGQYLRICEGPSPLLSFCSGLTGIHSFIPVTASGMRGADDHATLIVGIVVVVVVAVAVHVVEIVGVVIARGPQPPPGGAGLMQRRTCFLFNYLFKIFVPLSVPLHDPADKAYLLFHYFHPELHGI